MVNLTTVTGQIHNISILCNFKGKYIKTNHITIWLPPSAFADKITLRHLLSHSSGLGDDPFFKNKQPNILNYDERKYIYIVPFPHGKNLFNNVFKITFDNRNIFWGLF